MRLRSASAAWNCDWSRARASLVRRRTTKAPTDHITPRTEEYGEQEEPRRLIEGGLDPETPSSAGFIPDAVVVTCRDVEPVLSRRETGVVGLPAGAHVAPLGIPALQLVAEMNPLGDRETQRGVIDLEILGLVR